MKKILLSIVFLLSLLAPITSHATSTQYTWLSIYSTNCQAVTGQPAFTTCYETTDSLYYTCNPNAGITGTCGTSGEWYSSGGLWVDNGTVISLKNVRNIKVGTGIIIGDPTVGTIFNPSGDNATFIKFGPTGLISTPGGVQYTGPDAFLNINRSADRSSPNLGDLWLNTTTMQFVYWNGTALKRLPTYQIYANTFASPTTSASTMLLVAPVGLKIESINCFVDSGTVPMTIQQCSSTGTSCSDINTSITCSTTGANDGGGISTPNITSGNYVNLKIGTTSGSPTKLNVTILYTQNEP